MHRELDDPIMDVYALGTPQRVLKALKRDRIFSFKKNSDDYRPKVKTHRKKPDELA
jgi:hypothetical protein